MEGKGLKRMLEGRRSGLDCFREGRKEKERLLRALLCGKMGRRWSPQDFGLISEFTSERHNFTPTGINCIDQ